MNRPSLPVWIGYKSENYVAIFASYETPLMKRVVFCSAVFLFVFILVLLLNTVEILRPSQESPYSWFERSGALIGACAVYVEFKLKLMDSIMEQASMKFEPDVFQDLGKYDRYKNNLHRVALAYGVVGTLIWSYGSPFLVFVVGVYVDLIS